MRKGIAIMTATIRQCTSDDAGLIRSLGITTFRDTFAADNSRENVEDYLRHSFSPELVKSQLSEPESVFSSSQRGWHARSLHAEQHREGPNRTVRRHIHGDRAAIRPIGFQTPGIGHPVDQSSLQTCQKPEPEQNLAGRMGAQ